MMLNKRLTDESLLLWSSPERMGSLGGGGAQGTLYLMWGRDLAHERLSELLC